MHIRWRVRWPPEPQDIEHAVYNPQLDQTGHANKPHGNSSESDPEMSAKCADRKMMHLFRVGCPS